MKPKLIKTNEMLSKTSLYKFSKINQSRRQSELLCMTHKIILKLRNFVVKYH